MLNLMLRSIKWLPLASLVCLLTACSVPYIGQRSERRSVPESFKGGQDTSNTANQPWYRFFKDPNLAALIDTALQNNQDLRITIQEINIANNEVRARKAPYLPYLSIGGNASLERPSRYTVPGAVEAQNQVEPGKKFPDPLPNYMVGANINWEVDIWRKLRNARKAALYQYLATREGKNFMVTNLVAEIASAYYELMALDNQMQILKQNIQIQQNALEIVKKEKIAARVTELAVRRFEAEVLKNQSRIFYIQQRIIETENRINFSVGRFPQPVPRSSESFIDLGPGLIQEGIPPQLLENRPDIRQAELALAAAKLDVKAAKAYFYPSLTLSGGIGYQAYQLSLLTSPESFVYSIAGGLFAPIINRNAIRAYYYSATSRQLQQVYSYERTVIKAYTEVINQLNNLNNLQKSYELKTNQVQALTQSINLSTSLFKSARADYMEVLLTQRDALESRFELVDTKKEQMVAMVEIYRALGGGWR